MKAIVTQADGKIVVAGRFQTVPRGVRQGVARFNPDGTLDTTFANPVIAPLQVSLSPDGLYGFAVQPDGKILIGGTFTSVGGVARNHLARLNGDGSLDRAFQEGMDGTGGPGWAGTVYAIALQTDGKILIAGPFQTVNGVARKSLARLNPDGSLDTTFQDHPTWGEYDSASRIVIQPDGKILIGGWLQPSRLSSDGSVDASFTYGGSLADEVGCLALLPTGQILVGYSYGRNVTRLNTNGSIDAAFASGVSTGVGAFAVQSDGKIVVGGDSYVTGEATKRKVARLNANGSLDTSLLNGMSGLAGIIDGQNPYCYGMTLQADGRILIRGRFTSVNRVARTNFARLNPNGSHDATFQVRFYSGDFALNFISFMLPQSAQYPRRFCRLFKP